MYEELNASAPALSPATPLLVSGTSETLKSPPSGKVNTPSLVNTQLLLVPKDTEITKESVKEIIDDLKNKEFHGLFEEPRLNKESPEGMRSTKLIRSEGLL